jgi:hypothetical protein
MGPEIIFKIEKPETQEEILDFKLLKLELKAALKKGKLKVAEKFAVFAFIITDYTAAEQQEVIALFKQRASVVA